MHKNDIILIMSERSGNPERGGTPAQQAFESFVVGSLDQGELELVPSLEGRVEQRVQLYGLETAEQVIPVDGIILKEVNIDNRIHQTSMDLLYGEDTLISIALREIDGQRISWNFCAQSVGQPITVANPDGFMQNILGMVQTLEKTGCMVPVYEKGL